MRPWLWCGLLCVTAPLWAREGISTTFIAADLGTVAIGSDIVVAAPMSIFNLGETPVTVEVTPMSPSQTIDHSIQPIPDPQWLQIEPARLAIAARGEGRTTITLRVPKDSAFRGHRYQAMISASMVMMGQHELRVRGGLLSRVVFRVAPKGSAQ